jgi:hypothetical protein
MGKGNDAFQYLATTGSGIPVGTNIDLLGFIRGSDLAGTITVVDSATVLFTISASQCVTFAVPIACTGPVTMTSSAGRAYTILFRKRG